MQIFPVIESVGGAAPASADAARPGAVPPGGEPGAFLSTFAQSPGAGARASAAQPVKLIAQTFRGAGPDGAFQITQAAESGAAPMAPGLARTDAAMLAASVAWPASAEAPAKDDGAQDMTALEAAADTGEEGVVPSAGAAPVIGLAAPVQGSGVAITSASGGDGGTLQRVGMGQAQPASANGPAVDLQADPAQAARSGAAPGLTLAGTTADSDSAPEGAQSRLSFAAVVASGGSAADGAPRRDPSTAATSAQPGTPEAPSRPAAEARMPPDKPLSAAGVLPPDSATGRAGQAGVPPSGNGLSAEAAAAGAGESGRTDARPAQPVAPSAPAGAMMPAPPPASGRETPAEAPPASGSDDAPSDSRARTAAPAPLRTAADASQAQPAALTPADKDAPVPRDGRTAPADLPPPAPQGPRSEPAPAAILPAARPVDQAAVVDGARTTGMTAEPLIPDTAPLGDAPVADRPAAETGRAAPQPLDAPRPAMRAMAEALHRAADGAVELTLSPEELGRVRLTLNPGENGITVTILADRGETLDLMRRHADLLGNAMRELGYGEVVLDFGGKGARQGQAPQTGPAPDGAADHGAAPAPTDTPRPGRLSGGGGLDLRL